MTQTGSDWSVNLTLATGTYTFWANAYDSDGVKIFETDIPRIYTIDVNTTSLNLGLQLNPILEDVTGTPMPVITNLLKPSGYFPGTQMEIGFVVKGGSSDYLSFFVEAEISAPTASDNGSYGGTYDNSSQSTSVRKDLASVDLNSSLIDNYTVYNDSIFLDIPADATGTLKMYFGVVSDTLQSGNYIQFNVNQAVEVSGSDNNTLVFVPTVDEFWLGTNADDNGTNFGVLL